ncbi:MAG: polyphosphate kinase 1, partial [Pyrinomonadaceae bacterium]
MTIRTSNQTQPPTDHEGEGAQMHATRLSLATTPLRELLFNRELSLLEFFRRVLEEALDPAQPPLERLKFLFIFSMNLDEFFMIRVSGLKEGAEGEIDDPSPDGLTPSEQLREIRKRVLRMVAEHSHCLREEVLPLLESHGIQIVPYASLSPAERARMTDYFTRKVLPVLTPQGVDPGHPFPYISNLSLNLGLTVEPSLEHGITRSLTGKLDPRFVRIKLPPRAPRLVPVDDSDLRFVQLSELIAANTEILFPRMLYSACHTFRVTRDADIEVRDIEAEDLLRSMQQTLSKRRLGEPVRLEVAASMPAEMVHYLTNSLGLAPEDVYTVADPISAIDLMELYKLDRPELKDRPLRASVPAPLRRGESLFKIIKRQDLLLHHPYTSYNTVIDFIREAARDPDVQAIKMCLYRTGQKSPIPEALIEASERGKQVMALVELKARFDEEHNIEWAQRLEKAGVHVVYGLLGLKTHCKIALVVRSEGDQLRRYLHIATGNYNPATASVYTDLSLLTADEELGADATDLFNFLTGFSRQKQYRKLLVAPVNLRERMLGLIRREAEHARAGREARMIVKINRLADTEVIRALYEASQAGVRIELIIRGVCMLRPGVPGVSETISVRSVVGRFLEHSRAFYFLNGGAEEIYTGSSDWMSRNLDRRVEVVAPVTDPRLVRYLKEVLLDTYLRDNVKARRLRADGTYERVRAAAGEELLNSQLYFARSPELSYCSVDEGK